MFKKLHIQMTAFCTCMTGLLLLFLTGLCLRLTLDNQKTTSYQAFLSEMNTDILHLQEQEDISLRWLGQLQEKSRLKVFLYDNQRLLYTHSYLAGLTKDSSSSEAEEQLAAEVIDYAAKQYALDIRIVVNRQLTEHVEFPFTSSSGNRYYASVGQIPKSNGQLSFLMLYPVLEQQQRGRQMILTFALLDLGAILVLLVFFWYCTGKMIRPLEEAREKQTIFIASASHELRAPLAVWLSGLEVLAKADTREEREHFINLLQGEGVRMKHLVDEMLMLAGSDSQGIRLHKKSCQPDSLLLDIFEKSEPVAAKKGIRLSVDLPEELLEEAFWDPERVTQALEVLVSNALSYTPQKGRVGLSLRKEKQRLCFMVSDTGCGIPDGEKEKIFERFYRCDQSRTGKGHFGLGLCIAREIVAAHGGEIWVEDAPGGGSRFCISLPAKL